MNKDELLKKMWNNPALGSEAFTALLVRNKFILRRKRISKGLPTQSVGRKPQTVQRVQDLPITTALGLGNLQSFHARWEDPTFVYMKHLLKVLRLSEKSGKKATEEDTRLGKMQKFGLIMTGLITGFLLSLITINLMV